MPQRAPKTNTGIRQEQIAEAAMQLIGSDGLANLSIASIAERVGIVPSAVYRHFNSKDAVVDAVLDLLRVQMLANIDAARKESANAVERLHTLLMRHIKMLVENQSFAHVVFAQISHAGEPAKSSRLGVVMQAYLRGIEGIVREGQEAGEIRHDVPPQTIAVMFIGLVLPAALLYRLTNREFDPLAHVQAVWPVFRRGVAEDTECYLNKG